VHVGHIVAAADTRAALGLDRVLMVVAGDPWQKRGEVVASPADRLALVAAAVEDVEGVEASAVEIERGEPSVTYDTLSALAATGRKLQLQSDARYRFERGLDPEFVRPGMEVATRLILALCGGEPSQVGMSGAVPAWQRSYAFRPSRVLGLGGSSSLIMRRISAYAASFMRLWESGVLPVSSSYRSTPSE